MKELIERIEGAEEGSRELDAEIARSLGRPWDYAADWGPRGRDKPVAYAYTGSLDAAMSLVPEDNDHTAVFWQIGNDGAGGNPADYLCRVLVCSHVASKEYRSTAATPALALCAAALRAIGDTHDD